jgi:hypothetical protein
MLQKVGVSSKRKSFWIINEAGTYEISTSSMQGPNNDALYEIELSDSSSCTWE